MGIGKRGYVDMWDNFIASSGSRYGDAIVKSKNRTWGLVLRILFIGFFAWYAFRDGWGWILRNTESFPEIDFS